MDAVEEGLEGLDNTLDKSVDMLNKATSVVGVKIEKGEKRSFKRASLIRDDLLDEVQKETYESKSSKGTSANWKGLLPTWKSWNSKDFI